MPFLKQPGPVFRIRIRLKLKTLLLWTSLKTFTNCLLTVVIQFNMYFKQDLSEFKAFFMKEKVKSIVATVMKS